VLGGRIGVTVAAAGPVGDPFDALGDPHRRRIVELLGAGGRSVREIADELQLTYKMVRKALENLGDRVLREGPGVKAHPYTYRRAQDSFLSRPVPEGERTDSVDVL